MTEKNELINDIQKLKAERNRLLEQIKESEHWESVAWDSYYAVADHVNALDKKRYDSLNSEIDKLMEKVRGLADVLGLEIEELPLDFPFFALPAEEVDNE